MGPSAPPVAAANDAPADEPAQPAEHDVLASLPNTGGPSFDEPEDVAVGQTIEGHVTGDNEQQVYPARYYRLDLEANKPFTLSVFSNRPDQSVESSGFNIVVQVLSAERVKQEQVVTATYAPRDQYDKDVLEFTPEQSGSYFIKVQGDAHGFAYYKLVLE